MQRWCGIMMVCFLLVACSSSPESVTPMPSPTMVAAVEPVPDVSPTAIQPRNPLPEPTPTAQAVATPSPAELVQPFPLLGTPTPTIQRPLPEPIANPSDVSQLKPWRTLGFGGAWSPAFLPDGSELAVATSVGIVYLDSASLDIHRIHSFTRDDLRLSSGQDGTIDDLHFDPTGTIVNVRIYAHWPSGEEWRQYSVLDGSYIGLGIPGDAPQNNPYPVVESPNGTYLAEFPTPDSVVVPGVKVRNVKEDRIIYEDETSLSIAFAPDERSMAMTGTDNRVRIVDWETLQAIDRPFDRFIGATFSPDGQSLLTVSDSLQIWDVVTGNLVHTVQLPGIGTEDSYVSQMTYDSTGQFLTIVVNNPGFEAVHVKRYTFQIHSPTDYALRWEQQLWQGMSLPLDSAFNPTSDQYAVRHRDELDQEQLLVWHTGTDIVTQTLEYTTTAMEFSPTGSILALATGDNRVLLFGTPYQSPLLTIKTPAPLQTINFDADTSMIIGQTASGAFLFWWIADGTLFAEIPDPAPDYTVGRGPRNPLVVTDDPIWLLRPNQDNLAVIDLESQTVGYIDEITTMAAIGPFRRLIVSVNNGVVTLWGRQ